MRHTGRLIQKIGGAGGGSAMLVNGGERFMFRFRSIDQMKIYIHYNSNDLLKVKTNQGQATGLRFSL